MAMLNGSSAPSRELEDKTPIRLSVFPSEETISVIDPSHPLFGHEYELVETYYRQDGVGFCRVKVGQLGRSDVPLTATNLAIPIPISESWLSHRSLQQLLATYQAIREARDHAVSATADQEQEMPTNRAQNRMAVLDGQATAAVPARHRANLSTAGQSGSTAAGGV